MVKSSSVFPLFFGLGYIKPIKNKCGWIRYSLAILSCVSISFVSLVFSLNFESTCPYPGTYEPVEGGPQHMCVCWKCKGMLPKALVFTVRTSVTKHPQCWSQSSHRTPSDFPETRWSPLRKSLVMRTLRLEEGNKWSYNLET